MIRILFTCFFLWMIVLVGNVNAQGVTGSVSGMVKDEISGAPVDFAAVSIYKQGSEVATKNFMTDIEGSFVFTELAFGIYSIKISFIGYKPKLVEGIIINEQRPNESLLDIKLTPSEGNSIQEVVVTANKPLIEFGADTITFNADQSIHAEGSTVTDLLRSVPMVNVDADGVPTIAGKVNTRIFIDGKPSDYTSATMTDLLNVLPSEAIQKIEVITNPEVRYSADGDGIINIVLKKGYKLGLNSGLSFTTSTLGVHNGSAYAAYSDKKLTVNGNYGYRLNRSVNNVDLGRTNYNTSENISSYMNQISNSLTEGDSHNGRASANWDITPLQNLRASVNYNQRDNFGDSYLDDYRLNSSAVQTSLIDQQNHTNNEGAAFTFNADYTLKFKRKKGENLSVGITFFDNSDFRDRLLERITHRPNGTTINPYKQYRLNDIFNNRLELNLDYVKPLSKLATLSLGSQVTIGNNGNDQFVTGHNFTSQQDTVNNILTNKFDYQENIYAVYASYRLRTKDRWSFRAGFRSEFTDIKFKQTAVSAPDPEPYYNVFPNISINKSYKKKYNFGLSYSMRVTRPRENTLNPLIDDTNQSNVSFGNPNLKPAYINQFQLSFGTAGANWSFTPRLSYAMTTKIIERFRISEDSITYANLGSNQALTMGLFGNYKVSKSITLTGGYTLSRRSYKSESPTQIPRTGYSQRANMTLSGQLPQKISLEGQLNYYSNALAQGKSSSSVTTSFGFRKNFFNNKLTARIVASDPFANRNTIEIIDVLNPSGTNYHQERTAIIHTTNYAFTVGYRFSSTKKQKAKEDIKKVISNEVENKGPVKK